MKSNDNITYSKGDWIVHTYLGVGQIKKKEKKIIEGKKALYFKIKMRDGTYYWLPVDNTDSSLIRHIASPKTIKRALKILKLSPKNMSKDYRNRRKQISLATEDGSLTSIVRLIRDLNNRRKQNELNITDEDVLTRLIKQFAREWATCMGKPVSETKAELNNILQ